MWLASGGQGSDIGAINVAERDIPGHIFRHTGSKGTDLFMDVIQERVGRPVTLLLDVKGGTTIEVHDHGATCAEQVAADIIFVIAMAVKADAHGGLSDSFVDVLGPDVGGVVCIVVVLENVGLGGSCWCWLYI